VKESVIMPVYKNGSSQQGMSLSCSTCIVDSDIFFKLIPCEVEVICEHPCWFQHHKSTTDHTFNICEILSSKWQYTATAHSLFVHLAVNGSILPQHIPFSYTSLQPIIAHNGGLSPFLLSVAVKLG
jgi:hypothetical protein